MKVLIHHAINNTRIMLVAIMVFFYGSLKADPDYERALKRARYLLTGQLPNDQEIESYSSSISSYRTRIRQLITDDKFYNAVLRYHERLFGTGLESEYLTEFLRDDIDNSNNKFARIQCSRDASDGRLRCIWASESSGNQSSGGCPKAWEESVAVFWYPGIVAWACPSVVRACGYDLSQCFVEYPDEDEAKNSEFGTTEAFDSRFSVIKSLSKQSAGIATRIVTENYPYYLILKPGITAVDGAIAHFYRQKHHFKIDSLHIPNDILSLVNATAFTNARFTLVNTDESYEQAGVLTTFAYLRRYAKNRTRANEMYERLLCRKFTSSLPRVFPQDPGNLRTTEGCSGCHATLDPLADFWLSWGEEGSFYDGGQPNVDTYFAGKTGRYISDLAHILQQDQAFATCTTQNVWKWLMGRDFYFDEAELRAALANYFIDTQYSFRELVYAIATHPAFTEASRSDGTVTDPLEEPPLGSIPENVNRECTSTIDYNNDIAPKISMCTNCHNASSGDRVDLSTEAQWQKWGSQAVNLMASNQMPPGVFGPEVDAFKEAVRCWLEQ